MDLRINCMHGCQREAKTRGCCSCCYQRFRSLVKRGKTTWAKLEKAGKVKPASDRPTRRRALDRLDERWGK